MVQRRRSAVSVAVVVPAHRRSGVFERCLDAIGRMDPQPDEVVVVVDGGDPDTVARAADAGAAVVAQHPQSGPAVARNTGVARCTSDVVLFLDSDVEAAPDVVGRVAETFAADPALDAVIGSYDDTPAEPNRASQYKNLLNHWVHQDAREEGFTFWGACGAIRRSTFLAVGGFDETYVTPSVEDIELGYRLRDAGRRIRVVKDLQVKHLKRWTPASLLKTDVVHRALPWSALILRSGRMENDLNVDVAERAKSALTLLAVALVAAAPWWPVALVPAVAAVGAVVVLDLPFLRFLARRRGLGLAAWGAAWHLLYHLYAALGYLTALARHLAFGPHGLDDPWPGSPRRWHGRGTAPEIVPAPPTTVGPDVPGPAVALSGGPAGVGTLDPAVAHVETRVAHAAAVVPVQQLRRQSRRLRLWVPAALFVLGALALLPTYRDAVHVDGLAYVRVAEEYAAGRLDAALNAFWGPLYSWLLVPLLWLGVEPLLATKLLQIALGAATLPAIRRLCIACGVREATADGMALACIPLVLPLVYLNVFADLLLALVLLLCSAELVRLDAGAPRQRAWRAGLWGGLAFLAKPYALPVVVAAVVVVTGLRALAARRGDERCGGPAAVVRLGAWTLAATAAVVAPWAVVLTLHTGTPTLNRSLAYNAAVLAPGSTGQPLADGLVEPPHDGALFAWEEPSAAPVTSEGWSEPAEGARRVADLVETNLGRALGVAVGQFLPVLLLAAAGGWWVLRNTRGHRLRSPWTALVVVVAVYTGGYLLTLVEARYLWFAVLALVPLGASAIDAPYLRPSLTSSHPDFAAWRLAGFVVFAVALAVQAGVARPTTTMGQEVAELADRLGDTAGPEPLAGARVASDGRWGATSTLCFHLGCTYLGVSDDPAELRAGEVDRYVVWTGTGRAPAWARSQEPVLAAGDVEVHPVPPAGSTP